MALATLGKSTKKKASTYTNGLAVKTKPKTQPASTIYDDSSPLAGFVAPSAKPSSAIATPSISAGFISAGAPVALFAGDLIDATAPPPTVATFAAAQPTPSTPNGPTTMTTKQVLIFGAIAVAAWFFLRKKAL